MKSIGLIALTTLTIFLFNLWGCIPVPAPTFRTGEPIQEDRIKLIISGKTTKKEVFEWLGTPMAIATRDEITVILSPGVWGAAPSAAPPNSYKIQPETFFELFSGDHEINEYHRVYYYQYVSSKKTGYVGPFFIYESGKTVSDELWLLVNEKTGIIEDYVYKKHKE